MTDYERMDVNHRAMQLAHEEYWYVYNRAPSLEAPDFSDSATLIDARAKVILRFLLSTD